MFPLYPLLLLLSSSSPFTLSFVLSDAPESSPLMFPRTHVTLDIAYISPIARLICIRHTWNFLIDIAIGTVRPGGVTGIQRD
ncbi:hypothetical protein BGZ60DRAFT_399447 [Tricladium varicosporioides]|nr:hypothetical protein BGZ60DRAFT_399447 [Hymenoscyphus varicosporioides]